LTLREARKGALASVLGLRAWKLALAGPALYWYFPVFFALLSSSTGVSPLGLAALMVVMMVSAAWGFLVNDLADRAADSRSGRADALHGHGLGSRAMLALILATAGASWVVVFLIGGGYVFKVVLAVDYAIAVLYSVQPPKLKVRRFWGFLANSLMERPLPILVFLTYMNYYTYATVALPVLMELTWSVFKHQTADIRGDIGAGVNTFAASLGESLSMRIVMGFLNPLSVASLLSLLAIAWLGARDLRLPIEGAFAVTTLAILSSYLGERRGRLTTYITPTDPPYIIALNLCYRYVVLPVLAYGVLVDRGAYALLVLLLAISLGYQSVAYAKIARAAFGRSAREAGRASS
jgi:4-hydroxybenzoate polyprenyltransferase